MATVKTKMSKSAYVLIAIVVVAIITLPILHVVGILDLSFIGAAFMGVMMWGAADALNGILLIGGVFVAGALTYYVLKKYLIGTKVPITTPYLPGGQTVAGSQQQDSETVIS
jgi:hypothetical protein